MVLKGESTATETVAKFDKKEVIELILLMKTLDKDYALTVYYRERDLHPEWDLPTAIREAQK